MIVGWLHIVSFLVCLLITAFFGAAETALMSVSLSAWDRLRTRWPRVQPAYEQWTSNPSLMIATLLFGNTLASLGASVVANSLALRFAERHPVPVALLLFFTSLFAGATILIFGEILPKLYARHAAERVVMLTASLLAIVTRFLSPVLSVLSGMTEAAKKLLSFLPTEPLVTTDDLRTVVSAPLVEGLAPSARRMLSNIINFEQVKVSDVMIPRTHVIAIRLEQNVERMFEHIVRSGFSRVPIYFGTIDNIVGIVYAKDLLVEWRSSGLLVLEDLLRTPFRIAPEAPLSALLQGFRQGHHLAVVTDAHGRTQGVVTVEDVVESIVGDIADEFDQPR